MAADRAVPAAPEPGLHEADDLLQLVLTCCHPALAIEARVALTLRHVAGLSVAEIAAGFLVPVDTMAKRLVRARTKIRQTAISFELPGPDGLAERLSSVQAVLYLVFTEGHLASGDGPAVRADLCDPALRHRTISDLAFSWGFVDASHFSRAFKARFGCTAREVRQAGGSTTNWRNDRST